RERLQQTTRPGLGPPRDPLPPPHPVSHLPANTPPPDACRSGPCHRTCTGLLGRPPRSVTRDAQRTPDPAGAESRPGQRTWPWPAPPPPAVRSPPRPARPGMRSLPTPPLRIDDLRRVGSHTPSLAPPASAPPTRPGRPLTIRWDVFR